MLNATIVRRIDITKDLLILHVSPDAGVPDFLPGQYVALALGDETAQEHKGIELDVKPLQKPKLIKRAYSIGSPPTEKEYLEFYIAVVPGGELTPKVASLKAGDRIYVAPKITGTFTLKEVPQDANLVFVSTGTGIAPYMAMLRTPTTLNGVRRVSMIHGVRYETDLAYADELRAHVKKSNLVSYYPIVSRAQDTWSGEKGYVQKFFENGIINLNPDKDHVFLCGNPAMIEGMEKLLIEKGYKEHSRKSPGNMHLEKYW